MEENRVLHQLMDLIQYKDAYQQQSSGIQPQDMYVLERIHFHKTIQSRDLTRNYGIPPSTLTGILDRLETKKLIRRIRKNDDRRAIELVVTDGGEAVLQKHIREDERFVRNLYAVLPPEQSKQLFELLGELLGKADKESLFYENK